jgi:predicted nuclease of restriction endonuclease-like (RecB) superfamily
MLYAWLRYTPDRQRATPLALVSPARRAMPEGSARMGTMTETVLALPDGYADFLTGLKIRVREAQLRAQRVVNTQLIELYWQIGSQILAQQEAQGWGSGVIRRLAEDLRVEFPQLTGLSYRNLQYMRSFASAWPGEPIVQQPVAQLPWGHITVLLDKLDDNTARDWYAAATVEHGWSRNVLMNQIMNRTRERVGSGPNNFTRQLPKPDSELAQQVAKDPYVFDFLGLTGEVAERDMEQALMDRIVETLRELGAGFAFVGRQVHFDVGGDDFYLDLLFFHVAQLRYVVVELKTGKFQPEYAGKLGFYVAVVDDKLRLPAHNPTVGILICGSRNDHTVRYSLGQTASPLAVSTYTYDTLPADERTALPDAERLAAALDWTEEPSEQN